MTSRTKLSDFNSAARLREIIRAIVLDVLGEIYPSPRYGTVKAVNTVDRKATIEYPEDAVNTVDLSYGAAVPSVNDVVRVAGRKAARYIDDVLSDPPVDPTDGTQFGEESFTADGSGQFTVTFPSAYAAAPVVVASIRSSADRVLVINTISTTAATITVYDISAGTAIGSATGQANWVAMGTLAPIGSGAVMDARDAAAGTGTA